jgi:hypothetical protein
METGVRKVKELSSLSPLPLFTLSPFAVNIVDSINGK